MVIFNSTIRLVLCSFFLALGLPTILEAYPYAYRRLVLKQNGKITKVVELISDLPIPEVPMANPGRFNLVESAKSILGDTITDTGLVMERLCGVIKMGSAERALLAAFEKIGNRENGNKIQLFVEPPQLILKVGEIDYAKPVIQGEIDAESIFDSMISFHLAHAFPQLFGESKNKGLVFHWVEGVEDIEYNTWYSARNDIRYNTPFCDQTPLGYARYTVQKINASEYTHIIAFGSGAYCHILCDLLTKEHYTLEKSIGTEHDAAFETAKFKWKVFRRAPLIAIYRAMKAAERISIRMGHLAKPARDEKQTKMLRSVLKKNIGSNPRVKVDKDAQIIFDSVEKMLRGALCLHRDVVQMVPPLSPKVWKHLGA